MSDSSSSPIATEPVVETPSGKDAAYENFPVGSFLLPPAVRPHVAIFYRFARAIDDIADTPDLAPEEKIRRLDGFDRVVRGEVASAAGYETAERMRRSLQETNVPVDHCTDLIAAFKQDAIKNRYADWDDLMAYCRLSAAPVGRYLIDLHGGSDLGYGPSDALCEALQVINHLQDLKDDYLTLDRVYLPGDWMAEAGVEVSALGAEAASPALRRVIDRTLDATEGLLRDARPIAAGMRSRRLGMEAAAILRIAHALTGKLRREDPIAGRVQLSKLGYARCCVAGVLGHLLAPGRR